MKLLARHFVKNGAGSVKLVPEEAEDMWHAFNLIREGDDVTATTFRKVFKDTGTGADSERIKLKLTVNVTNIEFDPEGGILRLKGRNKTENEHVKLGAYHTVELELQRAFEVSKQVWDVVDINRIKQATDPQASADLAAVLITEGLANLVLVGASTTIQRARVETNLPRKRGPAIAGYEKAWLKFLDNVLSAVLRHIDWSIVKCLVIAGPGFAKDEFKQYLEAEAVKRDLRDLIDNKSKIVLASASSAYKHSLKEVLASPGIASRIKDTKAAGEIQALQDFFDLLSKEPSRAFYGPGHVFAAHELGAIQVLLISDNLFRINNVEKRRRFASLVDEVESGGGQAHIFSSMHVSGEQLNNLSGIAALLRFPLPDLEDADIPFEL